MFSRLVLSCQPDIFGNATGSNVFSTIGPHKIPVELIEVVISRLETKGNYWDSMKTFLGNSSLVLSSWGRTQLTILRTMSEGFRDSLT